MSAVMESSRAVSGHHSTSTVNKNTTSVTVSQVDSLSDQDDISSQHTFTHSEMLTVVKSTVRIVNSKIVAHFDDLDHGFYSDFTIENFLQFLSRERLTRMPHRGSRWDIILKNAEYFALQISTFGENVGPFILDAESAVHLALTNCKLLIELGPEQSSALAAAFDVLYDVARSISFLQKNSRLFRINAAIRLELGAAFVDVITLLGDVTMFYREKLGGMRRGHFVFDFNAEFGGTYQSFNKRKTRLADAMWNHLLRAEHEDQEIDIKIIRRRLEPCDYALRSIILGRQQKKHAEYTCEWFQKSLVEFVRGQDKVLSVNGQAGTGKSCLSSWIEERLQRPIGHKSYETIGFKFESDVQSELTSLALVKNLLLQLIERNLGDVQLYDRLAAAFKSRANLHESSKLEIALWQAFNASLNNIAESKTNMVILVDGLDKARSAVEIFEKLHSAVSAHASIRAIVLHRPISGLKTSKVHVCKLTAETTRKDMREVLKSRLGEHAHFCGQNSEYRERVIDHLVQKANGSFLWAVFMTKVAYTEKTDEGFRHVLEKAEGTVQDAIDKLCGKVDLGHEHTKHIISWLLVAERPLTVNELSDLIRTDLKAGTIKSRRFDVQAHIQQSLRSLLFIHGNGTVRFRHDHVRHHLSEFASKSRYLLTIDEARNNLTLRLLAYAKMTLATSEPSFEGFEDSYVVNLFKANHLLEYSVRHWTTHFRHSTMYSEKEYKLSGDFKAFFPDCPSFAKLEWACWERQTSTVYASEMHSIAIRVRRTVFSEEHSCVLQSHIILGSVFRSLSKSIEAATYFYKAFKICNAIMPKLAVLTTTCATTFLVITETITITTRTEIVTYREQTLKFMIEFSKHSHGITSDAVIRYYKALAKLYIEISEERRASECFHELYEIVVKRYGRCSEEAISISDQLTVVLHKCGFKQRDVVEYTLSILRMYEETMSITDIRRIKITIQLAEAYEACGEIVLAEETYIELWRMITEVCIVKREAELHIAMIDICLSYVKFLRRCHRHAEAVNLLICVYREYEHESFGSLTIILRLKSIGKLLRECGYLSIAISVFTSVWAFFKKQNIIEHEEATEVTILISETVEEFITTTTKTTTKTTTTTTTTVISETIVREIYQRTIKRCKTVEHYTELIKVCNAMVSILIQECRWSEAVTVIKESLSIVWKGVITLEGEIVLPGGCQYESILLAIRLAECHYHCHQHEETERIYIRIFHACMRSLKIEHEHIRFVCDVLVKFYEERHCHDKAIEIYVELLKKYRKELGETHRLTIEILYKIGSLCRSYGRKDAYSYYIEIFDGLNKGSHHCHHDAFEAAIILSEFYEREQRWTDVQRVCRIVFETFISRQKECGFSEVQLEIIYRRYITTLETHLKVEWSVLREVTTKYRDICVLVFGATASITIKALVHVARICELRKETWSEAVEIYEEVIRRVTTTTTTTTTVSTTTTTETTSIVKTVKKKLTSVYLKIVTSSSSKTTITRSIQLCRERYEELKIEYGCWHSKTLTTLRELVLLYKKLNTEESFTTMAALLQATIIEIVTKHTSAGDLFSAAVILASIHLECGLHSHGTSLLRRLQRVIIVRKTTLREEFELSFDHKVDKEVYVFLVAFEEALKGEKCVNYSEIMACLLTERMLYERFTSCVEKKSSIEVILVQGSCLRSFLLLRKREGQIKLLDEQLFEIFVSKYGHVVKTRREVTFELYVTLTTELARVGRQSADVDSAACVVADIAVKALLDKAKFQAAYDLAYSVFHFIKARHTFNNFERIGHGFRLSLHLAGHGTRKPTDKKLGGLMLELSAMVIQEAFSACQQQKIDVVRFQIEDLNDIICALGDQKNWTDLKWLLFRLWESRTAHQHTWAQSTIISIGKALVQARYVSGEESSAIHLCEDICYNLRRARGSLDDATLDMLALLSSMYGSNGKNREAMALHEEVLRHAVFGDDDGDDVTNGAAQTDHAGTVRRHLALLRQAFLRNGAAWANKPAGVYVDLYERLVDEFGGDLGVRSPGEWEKDAKDNKSKAGSAGLFVAPTAWIIQKVEDDKHRSHLHRVKANWGMAGYGSINGSTTGKPSREIYVDAE